MTRDIQVSDQTSTHLELILEIGRISEEIKVIFRPAEAYKYAEAVAHLRVRKTLGVFMLRGRPAAEHEVHLINVFKSPGDGRPTRTWREPTPPPPIGAIIRGRSITAVQSNAGTVKRDGGVVTGAEIQYRTGEEFIAFIQWGCKERWELAYHTLPVRNGRVVIPPSSSISNPEAGWLPLRGLSVSQFGREMERVGQELAGLRANQQ